MAKLTLKTQPGQKLKMGVKRLLPRTQTRGCTWAISDCPWGPRTVVRVKVLYRGVST